MNKNVNGLKLFILEYINETGNCDYSSNPKVFIQDFFNWFTENKSLSENSFYKYSVYNNEFSKKSSTIVLLPSMSFLTICKCPLKIIHIKLSFIMLLNISLFFGYL